MTQECLAKKLGISKIHLCLIETGKKDPSLSLLRDIAEKLKVEPSILLSNDDKWLSIQSILSQHNISSIETLLVDILKELERGSQEKVKP